MVILDNDKPYSYFNIETDIAVTKEWQVKFSHPVLNKPENLENVTVQDASGNKVKIKVILSVDGNTVIIKPEIPYKKGGFYYITVADTVSVNGKKQMKPIRNIFIVE